MVLCRNNNNYNIFNAENQVAVRLACLENRNVTIALTSVSTV